MALLCDKGSIIMIAATDLPVSERQLHRILKRASVGLARLGSFVGHGSGEIMIGFSTATRVRYDRLQRDLHPRVPRDWLSGPEKDRSTGWSGRDCTTSQINQSFYAAFIISGCRYEHC